MTHALEMSDLEVDSSLEASESTTLLSEHSSSSDDSDDTVVDPGADPLPGREWNGAYEAVFGPEEDRAPRPQRTRSRTLTLRKSLRALPIQLFFTLATMASVAGCIYRLVGRAKYIPPSHVTAAKLVLALGSCLIPQLLFIIGALPCFKRKWIEHSALLFAIVSPLLSLVILLLAYDMGGVALLWLAIILEAFFYGGFSKEYRIHELVPPNHLLTMRPDDLDTLLESDALLRDSRLRDAQSQQQ